MHSLGGTEQSPLMVSRNFIDVDGSKIRAFEGVLVHIFERPYVSADLNVDVTLVLQNQIGCHVTPTPAVLRETVTNDH